MKINTSLFLFVFLAFVFQACKKYDEGPSFSLKTKKQRVVNTWHYEEYIQYLTCIGISPCDGAYFDLTSTHSEHSIEFRDDNTFGETMRFSSVPTAVYEGTWEFINDKRSIKMCYDINCTEYVWDIKRLKEKEFWVEEIWKGFVWSKRKYKPL